MSTLEIRNPAYALVPGVEISTLPFPQLAEGATVKVAFLNNQKPNTAELLQLIGEGLGRRYRVELRKFFKNDAAHPAPNEVIRDIHEWADVAVLSTAD